MARNWVSVDAPDTRRPRALERLSSALDWLKDASDEGSAIRIDIVGGRRNEWPDPGAARRHWRRMRDKHLRRLERHANELEAEIQGDEIYRNEQGSWRCPTCTRYRRRNASFCDNCGTPKPGEAP